jgi:hypothetical protein
MQENENETAPAPAADSEPNERQSKENRVLELLAEVETRPKTAVEHALFQVLRTLFPEPVEEKAE